MLNYQRVTLNKTDSQMEWLTEMWLMEIPRVSSMDISLVSGNIWQLWRVICALCYGLFFGMIGHLYFCKSPCPKSKISWFSLIFSRTKPIWLYKTCPHLLSNICVYIYSVSFGQVTFIHKPENIFKCVPIIHPGQFTIIPKPKRNKHVFSPAQIEI